jgi:hypothetical protein
MADPAAAGVALLSGLGMLLQLLVRILAVVVVPPVVAVVTWTGA